jgi:enterochelin esterase-like enzyme
MNRITFFLLPLVALSLTACSCNEATIREEYSLTLTFEGNGAVSSEKTSYYFEEEVSVTATPGEGFYFDGWHENEQIAAYSALYSFAMPDRDLTLHAVFTSADIPAESVIDMSQTIESATFGTAQHYAIYLPSCYSQNPDKKYPVLYLLHGYGGDYTGWVTAGRLKAIADEAIRSGEAKEMIIVCPNGYNSFYCNGYISGMNYEDYMINDLFSAIESTYRINASKGGRAIAGLSMGGFGATYHAFKRPEMFSSCFAMSAAFIGGNNLPSLESIISSKSAGELSAYPAFVMECGTEDNIVISLNDALHDFLTQAGLEHTYTRRPGVHNWIFWQACLPKAMKLASDNFE